MRDHVAAPDSAAEVTNLTDDEFLAAHAKEIRTLGKRMVAEVIDIGRRLADCHDRILKDQSHAAWLDWLDREFGWAEKTARNFINVHEMQALKSVNFTDLSLPVSSLYLLAAPSTPEQVRTEVLDRAAKGEKVSHKDVKEAIGRARPAKVATTRSTAAIQLPAEQTKHKDICDDAPLSPTLSTGTDDGLILLACLRAFDRHGLLGYDPEVIARTLSGDNMKDVRKRAPTVANWLSRIKGPAPAADEPQFLRRSEPGTMLKKM